MMAIKIMTITMIKWRGWKSSAGNCDSILWGLSDSAKDRERGGRWAKGELPPPPPGILPEKPAARPAPPSFPFAPLPASPLSTGNREGKSPLMRGNLPTWGGISPHEGESPHMRANLPLKNLPTLLSLTLPKRINFRKVSSGL